MKSSESAAVHDLFRRKTAMRTWKLLLAIGALFLVTGCATSDEWQTWKEHPTHFASGDHMFFSTRNGDKGTPRVTRQDIALARDQGWWGKPITVTQESILER
jgi:hypothetical protein